MTGFALVYEGMVPSLLVNESVSMIPLEDRSEGPMNPAGHIPRQVSFVTYRNSASSSLSGLRTGVTFGWNISCLTNVCSFGTICELTPKSFGKVS